MVLTTKPLVNYPDRAIESDIADFDTKPSYQEVNGIKICGGFIADHFIQAINYHARDDDIFIATYPKCGTTWTQQIVYLLLNQGKPPANAGEYFKKNPFLDMLGTDSVINMPRPGAIKTHLPFNLIPYNARAKYIVVVRNPKDALVSFYHHTKGIPGYKFARGSFDTFFECFISGNVDYGDYFDHLISWWNRRHNANVIFLTFEEMKADIRRCIHKIASFIDKDLDEGLSRDAEFMERVIKFSSFDYMKEQDKIVREIRYGKPDNAANDQLIPLSMKAVIKNMAGPVSDNYAHIRKGIVNDWKNHLSKEQNERLLKKFFDKCSNTGLINLWPSADWI